MPFVPVTNTVQVNVVYSMDSQEVENTLYYKRTSTVDITALGDLTETINAYLQEQLLPFLGNTLKLIRLVSVLLDAADSLIYTSTTGLPIVGGASGECAPNNVALCMSIRSAARGRSARGRNFIPGIPKDLIDENTVASGNVAAYEDAYAGLIGIGGDSGFSQVVVSRFSGFTIVDGKKVPTPRVSGVTHDVINSYVVDPTIDSQRRRLPGRGR